MTHTPLTVFPNRYAKGWDGTGQPQTVYPTADAIDAFAASYPTDAHFAPYYVVDSNGAVEPAIPRLNQQSLAALRAIKADVRFASLWLDFDCPDDTSIDAWRAEQQACLAALPADLLSGCAGYDTRGGYRLGWQLVPHCRPEDYVIRLAQLRKALEAHGLKADPLIDWNRIYRLPRVRRDNEDQRYACYWSGFGPLRMAPAPAASAFGGIEDARQPFELPDQITENRNITLTRYAGKLRWSGLDAEEILAALQVAAKTRCAGWEPATGELEHIARSIGQRPTDAPADAPAPTTAAAAPALRLGSDVELADLIGAVLEQGTERLIHDRARLWRYDGSGIWRALPSAELQNLVATYDGTWIQRETQKGETKYQRLVLRQGAIEATERRLKVSRTQLGWLDDSAAGIAFRDVFVAVDATELRFQPHSPDNRATVALPFDYIPDAQPKAFLAFLERMQSGDRQSIALLREFMGVALLGVATRYQQALMLTGGGSNGKSVFLDVLMALFDTPDGKLVTAVSPTEMDNEYRRDMLSGARLNVCTELESGEVLTSGAVKGVIDGSPIVGREIRESPYRFRTRCASAYSVNDAPPVRDTSHGFWRRWIVVPWEVTIDDAEADRNLTRRIIDTELAQIASWAVDGARATLERGCYAPSERCIDALHEWRYGTDPLLSWITEHVAIDNGLSKPVPAADVHSRYARWAVMSGHKPMSLGTLGRRLKALRIPCKRNGTGVAYGLAFKS